MIKTLKEPPLKEIQVVGIRTGKIVTARVIRTDEKGVINVALPLGLKADGTVDRRKSRGINYLGWQVALVDPIREEKANAARAEIASLEVLLQAAQHRLYAVYEDNRKYMSTKEISQRALISIVTKALNRRSNGPWIATGLDDDQIVISPGPVGTPLTPSLRTELATLLGLDSIEGNGVLIEGNPTSYVEYLNRAQGFKPPAAVKPLKRKAKRS